MATPSGSTYAFIVFAAAAAGCGDDTQLINGGSTEDSSGTTGPTPGTSTGAEASATVTSATTGLDSSTGVADTSSSTGVPTTCGNGEIEDGEQCDDHNNSDGDACHADCTNAFEVIWTQEYNGVASATDAVAEVVVDAQGNSYALGGTTVVTGADLWVRQYLPDGSEGWTFTYDGAAGGDDGGTTMLLLPDGDIVVAGSSEVEGSGVDILLLRIDGATRAIEWQVTVDGPGTSDDSPDIDQPRGIAATADGGFVVIGSISVAGQHDDVWVARYDGAGTQLWSTSYDDEMHVDNRGYAVLVGPDETVYALCQDYANLMSTGRLLLFDGAGVPQGEPQTFDLSFTNAAWTSDGNLVATGFAAPSNTLLDVVTRKYDTDFVQIWEAVFDGAMDFDIPYGLTVDANDQVYVVGSMVRVGEQDNAFIEVYDAEGEPLWGDEYNGDLDIGDAWRGVGVDGNGDVVVGGYVPRLGEMANSFVRKYQPQ